MKVNRLLFFLALFQFFILSAYTQERITKILSDGWKFSKGQNDHAEIPEFDDSGWQQVTVPHDWAISGPFIANGDGNTGKLPWKDEGWYRKKLRIPSSFDGLKIYLLCDGIMAFPEIYVNGELAGKWDYGYNSFYLDITDFVNTDSENLLAIHVDTRNHDSRWYPGGGIYRKISLIAVNPVHADIWGTYITTPMVKSNYADVRVATTVNNNLESVAQIRIKQVIETSDKFAVAEGETGGNIDPGSHGLFETTLTVLNPRLWDIENPELYTLKTEIFIGQDLVDSYFSSFGIRKIRFTANNGFYLNDRRVQLKGVNLHHDHGPIGTAFNTRAMERQLEIMKEMGCNAVRTSHNTAAPELLDLCDRMGILVFNEIFDKYDGKADITDTTNFENFAFRNIRNFVKRDRNHPSLFLWSVGNEIGDVQWNINNGFYKLQTMLNLVERFDNSRPTTLVCDSYQSAELRHFDYYDIHSWNYGRRYSLARQLEPGKAVIISESASTLSTRGFYEFPLPEKKTDFTNSLQVSSYDLNAPEWAEVADDDFMWQQEEEYIAGEFVWTGFDYLGEPTPYGNYFVRSRGLSDSLASRSSYFGIVDLCGIPKDRYWLYRSYWRPDETTIHILPHWNWEERTGQNVPVFVYTNGDCAELFVNGVSQGMKCKNPKSRISVERFRLMWNDIIYQPGEIKAIAYKDGKVIGEKIIKTAGKPYKLKLTPDRAVISPGNDLSYILVEAIDKDGNLCPIADNKLTVKIEGAGELAGAGNGNPQSLNSFKSGSLDLFYGKAMIIVSSDSRIGKIVVQVDSKLLNSEKVIIEVE